MFANGLNMDLQLETWVEKIVYEGETHWHFGKEKVPSAAFCKEGNNESWNDPSQLISLKKGTTANNASYRQFLRQYFILCVELSL